MESRFLLDVVVGEGTTVLQLLASKDQTLLIGRNAFLVLNLCLNVVDCVRGLNLQSDGLASHYRDKTTVSGSPYDGKRDKVGKVTHGS